LCHGEKTKRALDEIYVYIERGTPDGHTENFKDAADEYVNIRAGEVIFKIVELEHSVFKRKGDNLHMT
jgi:DnaJ family protein A protein 2